jgi:cytochrome P450
MKRLEPILERHAEKELAPLLARGHGDICQEFASNYCGWVEAEWLCLDEESGKSLARNVGPFVQSWRGGNWDHVKKASDEFYEIARNVMADRRVKLRDPEEDPASSLLMERDAEGNPLDEYHLV